MLLTTFLKELIASLYQTEKKKLAIYGFLTFCVELIVKDFCFLYADDARGDDDNCFSVALWC